MLTFGTVCDGIGCGHLAFNQVGFECAWSFEIEPFPSAVLAERFPEVPNHGDMNKCAEMILSGKIDAPDVFIGGTPCQSWSVAGKRKGLEDARGNLSLTFCWIADAVDDVRRRDGKPPCVVLWENVPGVLSDKGNGFGCILGELSGAGCQLRPPGGRWRNAGCVFGPRRTVAWRVLDSQFFGVAQRRRRVFVVASAGDWCRPEEVLLIEEGVRRDSPPSREAGEGVTHDLAPCLTSGGRGVERRESRGQDPVVAVCHTLRAGGNATGGHRPPGTDVDTCDSLIPVHTTGAGYWRVGMGTLRAREQDSHENVVVMAHGQANAEIGKNVCPTLNCNHEVPIATYDMRGNGDGVTVGCLTGDHARSPTDYTPVVAIQDVRVLDKKQNGRGYNADGTSYTVDAMATQGVATSMQVRRLTPRETERLQALPDGWTLIPWRGKPASDCPDGPRYKGIGNGQTVNVMRWLAERIKKEIAK